MTERRAAGGLGAGNIKQEGPTVTPSEWLLFAMINCGIDPCQVEQIKTAQPLSSVEACVGAGMNLMNVSWQSGFDLSGAPAFKAYTCIMVPQQR